MADSATSKLLSTIEKFDGTNWESWAFSIKAAFMFIDALNIAEGTEKEPHLSTPSKEDEQRQLEDWKRRSRQGLSLLLISVKPTVHQSLDMAKSLTVNWSNLKAAYGTRTCYTLSRSRDSPSSVTVLWAVGLRRVHSSVLSVIMIIPFTHPSPNSVPPTFHVSDLSFVSCFRSYSHFPFCSIFEP